MITKAAKRMSRADEEYGYEFGIDGVLTVERAAQFLDKSERYVRQMVKDGHFRKGKGTDSPQGHVIICKRSILEWLKSRET